MLRGRLDNPNDSIIDQNWGTTQLNQSPYLKFAVATKTIFVTVLTVSIPINRWRQQKEKSLERLFQQNHREYEVNSIFQSISDSDTISPNQMASLCNRWPIYKAHLSQNATHIHSEEFIANKKITDYVGYYIIIQRNERAALWVH